MNNITKVYQRATSQDIADGQNWYNIALNHCKGIAKDTGVNLSDVCAVAAALSPNNKWNRNILDASNLIKYGLKAKFCTYGSNVEKAMTILENCNGDSEKAIFYLRGKKVTSFYHNIYFGEASPYVTIDGHAVNIAMDVKQALTKVEGLTPKKYDYFSSLYKETASEIGIPVIHLQAVTWVTWRRHGTNQLALSL